MSRIPVLIVEDDTFVALHDSLKTDKRLKYNPKFEYYEISYTDFECLAEDNGIDTLNIDDLTYEIINYGLSRGVWVKEDTDAYNIRTEYLVDEFWEALDGGHCVETALNIVLSLKIERGEWEE